MVQPAIKTSKQQHNNLGALLEKRRAPAVSKTSYVIKGGRGGVTTESYYTRWAAVDIDTSIYASIEVVTGLLPDIAGRDRERRVSPLLLYTYRIKTLFPISSLILLRTKHNTIYPSYPSWADIQLRKICCYVLWTQNFLRSLSFDHRLDLTNVTRAAGSTEGLGPFPVLHHRHLEPHTN